MWENAAQMQIVSLNWWQYAESVWSHANNAEPPNSHLAPKLKDKYGSLKQFTTYWWNMLLPFWPLQRPEEPWHDEACSRPGSAPFLVELQPTPGGQHCLVQLRWKGGHPCLGSRLTFDLKHAQLDSCLDSELASPWPQHPVGSKRLPCHVLYGAKHCLGRTQCYVQTPPSPMATFDSSGSGCTDAGWWPHPP